MKNKNHCIISFEGLDCSFKETNYEALVSNLEHMRDMQIITGVEPFCLHRESFPRYGSWSAVSVEKWLNGSFDRNVLKHLPKAIDSMYSIDRFAYWYEKDGKTGKRQIDLLDDNSYHLFVFDRYNLSSAIYNPIHPDSVHIEDFTFDSENYAIPNPDITFWMRMSSFDVLAGLIANKKNKDANELDLDFLRSVWERSEKVINSTDIFDSIGTKLIIVDCLNPDFSIKSRKEIERYIYSKMPRIGVNDI
jgi:thymidylate kinase